MSGGNNDISANVLWKEVEEIVSKRIGNDSPVHYKYRAEIDVAGETIHPYQLLHVDVRRNYNELFSDEVVIKAKIARAHYERVMRPNRDDIWVTLYRERYGSMADPDNREMGSGDDPDPEDVRAEKNIEFFRYRGVLIDTEMKTFESERPEQSNRHDLSQEEFEVYSILLLNPAVEKLLTRLWGWLYENDTDKEYIDGTIRTSGIYREARLGDILRAFLTDVSKDIEVDEEFEIAGVDMVEPDNQTEYEHVIIPHDIRLLELPKYLQEHCGGLYQNGLGFYLQYCPGHTPGVSEQEVAQYSEDRQQGQWFWFVYPEYDTQRFDQVDDNLTIINIPQRRLEDIEKTYLTKTSKGLFKKVVAISTGDVKHIDESESLEINRGSGVRWVHGTIMEEGLDSVDPGGELAEGGPTWKVEIDSEENIEKHIGYERRSGEDYIPLRPRRITSNPYLLQSRVASQQGTLIRYFWQNGDPELIYPGMPVRLYHMFDNDLDEYNGIVIGCDYETYLKTNDIVDDRMQTDVLLTLFVERPEKLDAEWFQSELLEEDLGEVLADQ